MGVAARVRERGAAPALESGAAGRARLSREGALQIEVGECELGLPGKARGHGELDPPDATTDQGTDLQQLQPDGAAGGIGKLGVAERDPAQLAEQHVSHRREPQAQLVGLHGRRRRAVGEQVELAFLDAVFHLAAGAIEIFVEAAGVDLFPAQAGHHETRIGTVGQVLGLAHNPPRSAPGGLCLVGEIPEQPSRLAGGSAQPRCLPGLGRQHRLQARVGRQAEQVSDTLGLAPRHQLLAAEARIAAQHDPHLRPAGPDAGDDPGDLVDRAGGPVDVGGAQLGAEQEPAAEDVERQVAIAVVVAMEEPTFLLAVDRVVGGVEVEHDLLRRSLVAIEEDVHEQCFQARRIVIDLVILPGLAPRPVLQPVERALAGHRRTVRTLGLELAGQHMEQRVVTKLIVVVQVFIAEREGEHALADQGLDRVLEQSWVAPVGETAGHPTDQPEAAIQPPQQQPSGIRCDDSAIEPGHNLVPFNRFKFEQCWATLCLHRGLSGIAVSDWRIAIFRDSPPRCIKGFEKSGLGRGGRLLGVAGSDGVTGAAEQTALRSMGSEPGSNAVSAGSTGTPVNSGRATRVGDSVWPMRFSREVYVR